MVLQYLNKHTIKGKCNGFYHGLHGSTIIHNFCVLNMKHQEEYTTEDQYEDNQEQYEAEVNQWQRYFEEEMKLSPDKARKLMKEEWEPSYNKWLDSIGSDEKNWWRQQDDEVKDGNQ